MHVVAQTGYFVIVPILVQNVSMLVAMSVLLVLITRRLGPDTFPTRVLSGLLFGAAVMVGMATPLRIVPGVIFDARSVLLAVAGFAGGPFVGFIAGAVAVGYRIALGGSGMWVGVAVVVEATGLGVLMYYARRRNAAFARIPVLLGFGLVVHIAMLLTQLALPGGIGPDVLRRIGLPVLAFFPAATALVCRMLLDQEEREQEIEATRVSEERYRILAENTADVIWEVDVDLVGVYANPAVESLIGYTPEEFVGLPLEHYCDSESLRAIQEAVQQALARLPEGTTQRFEALHRTREGGCVEVEITASVVLDSLGVPVGFQGVTRDVSARRAQERAVRERNDMLERMVHDRTESIEAVNAALIAATAELESANQQLREANEAKNQFLRSMSHELRTPLNSIIGFSDILQNGLAGELNEEQERQAAMINTSGHHLLLIINDILDLARIEARVVKLEIDDFDAAALALETAESVMKQADAKGIRLVTEFPDEPVYMRSDPRKVRQIILNLLSNAIKFTSEGSVRLVLRSHEGRWVQFSVIDTGRGIAEELRDRVFVEYIQAGGPREEGTGLGLAISRSLAGILGGTLTLTSEVGVGSTFVLSLPTDAGPLERES